MGKRTIASFSGSAVLLCSLWCVASAACGGSVVYTAVISCAAMIGYVVGRRTHPDRLGPGLTSEDTGSTNDPRKRFLIFTQLVLDLLPVFLRLFVKKRWFLV